MRRCGRARHWSPGAPRPRSCTSRWPTASSSARSAATHRRRCRPGSRSGTTGVIRRAERNSDIVAVADVDVVVIPGELYARAWLRPLTARRARGAAAADGQRMTMTTVERVVALQRVRLFADVPGRTLAALAQRAPEVEVEAGGSSSSRGPSRTTCTRSWTGALRVHRGERDARGARARRDGGRARGARAGAASRRR